MSRDGATGRNVDLPGLARVYRVFGRHYRGHEWTLVTATLGLVLTVLVAVLSPWPLKLIVDHVVLHHRLPHKPGFRFLARWSDDPATLLVVLVVAFIALRIGDSLASYIHKVGLLDAGNGMVRDIRKRIFAHLQRLSLSFHDSNSTGDLIYRLLSDVSDLKILLIEVPDEMGYRILTIGSHVVLMLLLDWRLALLSFAVLPILWYINLRVGKQVKTASKKRRTKESAVANVVWENVTTMALIQAYGREDLQQERFEVENRASLGFGIEAMKLSKMFKRTTDLLVAAGTAAVVYLGGRLALEGAILPGTLILFVAYLRNLYGPIDKLSGMMLDIAGAQASADRLLELVDCDLVMTDAPDAKPAGRLAARIEYRNVCFGYRRGVDVLKDVSFTVEPGESIALIGPNGAGKSTLLSLLLRLYDPRAGQILIDGTDARDFTLKSLRANVAVVLQEAKLFNKTVRENIAFGRSDATDAEIVRAAEMAQAHDFIMRMPQGYDSMIVEGGDNMSGGERQRLNIARAIVRNAPLVILDEPVTALDARTEAKVREALDELTRGKTSFTVAHKLGTITSADRVLVLEDGRVVAFGRHDELIETSDWYRTLHASQSADWLAHS